MAKTKTHPTSIAIKQKSIAGIGLKSPWENQPGTKTPSPVGGNFYGTGVRNKMATLRKSSTEQPVSKKELSTPPKSLA